MADKRIGIAVLGAGRIGALHALNVARNVPGARLVAVADVDIAAAERAVDVARQGRAIQRYQEALEDQSVDAVVIATPTDTHAAILVEAARHGKHVFCEKPVAQSLEVTRGAIDQVTASGVLLQLGFNRRFDPAFAEAQRRIRQGDIGEPYLVRMVGRDPSIAPIAYLKSSGGQFKDQAVHEFDMARWLIGSDVEEVSAIGSVLVDPAVSDIGDVDTSVTTLRFNGGRLGIVDCCRRCVYGYDIRAEVHGSEGAIFVGGYGGAGVTLLGPDRAALAQVAFFIDRFVEAFQAELVHFVACVISGKAPSVGGEDGYLALRVAVAAGRSLRERRVIRVDEVTEG
jgi:inositol 2-dehydrogenase